MHLIHHRPRRAPAAPGDQFIQLYISAGCGDGNGAIPFILHMAGDAECDCFFFGGLAVIHPLYFSGYMYGDRSFQGSEGDEVNDLLEIYLIRFIECTEFGAVHIQYALHDTLMDQGDNDL